ncbi:MAG: hypothetical protein K1X75_06910 [Leptospirales bacterium]|nr:hypothetical protein [Leptospirales bacterium]
MKYYYRSPKDLSNDREERARERSKLRNRILWIIVADLAIVVLVMLFVQQSGALQKTRVESSQPLMNGDLEMRASVNLQEASKGQASVFLSIHNRGAKPLNFPAGGEDLQIIARMQANSGQVYTVQEQARARNIAPGETSLYRLEIQAVDVHAFQPQVVLQLKSATQSWELSAP